MILRLNSFVRIIQLILKIEEYLKIRSRFFDKYCRILLAIIEIIIKFSNILIFMKIRI
jgi:hypothetical protein